MSRKLKGLFYTIAEASALTMAFARVKENGGAPGTDHVTIERFEKRLRHEIGNLVEELLESRYQPRIARPVKIPKKSGGTRQLMIPAVRDRVVQTAASQLLVPGFEPIFEESSFGYRPGRSVDQAIWKVDKYRREGLRWAVDADIKSYFDNVSHEHLILRLNEHVNDERFTDLVSLWLETYGDNGKGLPQGSPISPVLANLFLDPLDEAFKHGKSRIVRYADDFVLLAPTRDLAEEAREKASKLLGKQGLKLHPEKTRIVSFDQGFRFLGCEFVRSIVIEDPWDEGENPTYAPAELDESKDRTGRSIPSRRTLYLASPGTRLSLGTGDCLEVSQAERPRLRLRPEMLDRLEIYPDVEVDMSALRTILETRVPVAFMNAGGDISGMAGPRVGINAKLHLEQAKASLEEQRRFKIAKAIVSARIHNQRALLRRLNRSKNDLSVVRTCEEINRVLRKLPKDGATSTLMAYEARSAKLYWDVLGQMLPETWIFLRRRRRPPETPFDALLSFLSVILTNDIEGAVLRAGLHPGFAVLHSVKNGNAACATDLVEEFRGPVAEACAVTLAAQRAIKPEGFEKGHNGFHISSPTREAIIRGYERWLSRSIKDPKTSTSIPWRQLILRQAKRYAKALLTQQSYKPYRMDY